MRNSGSEVERPAGTNSRLRKPGHVSINDAMLTIGGTPSDDDFITKDVLDELLSLELVYWREGELEFTTDGERVFKELAAE